MSKLEKAIERLKRAAARLEAACAVETEELRRRAEREAEKERLRSLAGQIAARVDDALARIGRVLREEG